MNPKEILITITLDERELDIMQTNCMIKTFDKEEIAKAIHELISIYEGAC